METEEIDNYPKEDVIGEYCFTNRSKNYDYYFTVLHSSKVIKGRKYSTRTSKLIAEHQERIFSEDYVWLLYKRKETSSYSKRGGMTMGPYAKNSYQLKTMRSHVRK